MSIVFNPFTGNFDFTGGASSYYLPTVATEGDLPTGDIDGAVRIVLATDRAYVYDSGSDTWTDTGLIAGDFDNTSTPDGVSFSLTTDGNIIRPTLNLHAADATNPGAMTPDDQTFAGVKTFQDQILADGGIDITATGGTDTLNIGFTNADIINIGRSGVTINLIGDTVYENVTNLDVADKNITINKGGSAGSASAAGIDVEENNSITGYVSTSGSRNSWELKAPNTAGVATITPGASGIVLDQSSHNPVTIGTANGLSLSTQQLSMALSDNSTTGALSAADHTSFAAKVDGPASSVDNTLPRYDGTTGKLLQSSSIVVDDSNNMSGVADLTNATQTTSTSIHSQGTLQVDGQTTLNTSLSGPVRATAGVISTGNTSLTSEVSGILPIANGGTNSNTTLNNNRVMQSSGGKIVEAAAITANKALASDSNGIPVASTTTDTELGYVSGVTSALQTQLNNKQPLDSTLTSLAAYNTNGLVTQTAADTFTGRTITGTASNISVSNGDGVAGNPTIDLVNAGTAGTYGSSTQIPVITTDAKGRVTSVTLSSAGSTGDIAETSFVLTNNQASAANVTGFAFANATVRSFQALVSVEINATSSLFEVFEIRGIQKGSNWDMIYSSTGDTSGVVFSITSAGQIQYQSTNNSGFTSGKIKFRSITTTVG